MSITRIVPPIDYLHTASRSSLQSFELARLNHAANLRREIAVLIDQWLEETAEAMLARWMIEHHGSVRVASAKRGDRFASWYFVCSGRRSKHPRALPHRPHVGPNARYGGQRHLMIYHLSDHRVDRAFHLTNLPFCLASCKRRPTLLYGHIIINKVMYPLSATRPDAPPTISTNVPLERPSPSIRHDFHST